MGKVLTCAACSRSIAATDGCVSATYKDIGSSGPVTWQAWHYACHPGTDGYDIPLDRLTYEGVDLWTARLADKTWMARSNWHDLFPARPAVAVPAQRSR